MSTILTTNKDQVLSKYERQVLINQFQILSHLNPDGADDYKRSISALQRGFVSCYPEEVFMHMDEEVSESVCKEVEDILWMFSLLEDSYNELDDKAGIDPKDLKFRGFDATNNPDQYAYMRHIIEIEQRYMELKVINSHSSGTLPLYRQMLEVWKRVHTGKKLTKTEMLELLGAGRIHASNR